MLQDTSSAKLFGASRVPQGSSSCSPPPCPACLAVASQHPAPTNRSLLTEASPPSPSQSPQPTRTAACFAARLSHCSSGSRSSSRRQPPPSPPGRPRGRWRAGKRSPSRTQWRGPGSGSSMGQGGAARARTTGKQAGEAQGAAAATPRFPGTQLRLQGALPRAPAGLLACSPSSRHRSSITSHKGPSPAEQLHQLRVLLR